MIKFLLPTNQLTVLVLALVAASYTGDAFAPTSTPASRVLTGQRQRHPPPLRTRIAAEAMFRESTIITPEGFGFSAPASRVLNESKRGKGFYKAQASDSVIDVMEAITSGSEDVALVYEDDTLLGLFTEADYIRVSHDCECFDLICFHLFCQYSSIHFLNHYELLVSSSAL